MLELRALPIPRAITAPPQCVEARLIHSTFEGPCRLSFIPKPRPLTMASSPNFSRTASSALSTLLPAGPNPLKRSPWITLPISTRSWAPMPIRRKARPSVSWTSRGSAAWNISSSDCVALFRRLLRVTMRKSAVLSFSVMPLPARSAFFKRRATVSVSCHRMGRSRSSSAVSLSRVVSDEMLLTLPPGSTRRSSSPRAHNDNRRPILP